MTFEMFPVMGYERLMNRFHLKADTSYRAFGRGLVLALLAWGPMAIWSVVSGNSHDPQPRLRFILDFAAYAQFWIGIPLLSLAQPLLGRRISKSVSYMLDSGFIPQESREPFTQIIAKSQRLIQLKWIEIVALVVTFLTPLGWIIQEYSNGVPTWHALVANGVESVTFAGAWEGIVALPLFWILIYRWIWRVLVWFLTLYKISRLKLNLKASHPDRMGGLGFISTIQTNFGLLIFVFGCVTAATALYKIIIEKVPVSSAGVWVMIIPFMILGPAAFIAPLLVFTPTLLRLRMKSQFEFSKLGVRYADDFDRKWIQGEAYKDETLVGSGDIQSLADIESAFKNTMSMKMIPLDIGNMFRLLAAAVGPMIPVIVKIIPKNGWLGKFLGSIFG